MSSVPVYITALGFSRTAVSQAALIDCGVPDVAIVLNDHPSLSVTLLMIEASRVHAETPQLINSSDLPVGTVAFSGVLIMMVVGRALYFATIASACARPAVEAADCEEVPLGLAVLPELELQAAVSSSSMAIEMPSVSRWPSRLVGLMVLLFGVAGIVKSDSVGLICKPASCFVKPSSMSGIRDVGSLRSGRLTHFS